MPGIGISDSVTRNTKRKRVNGNDGSRVPEMKKYNPFFPGATDAISFESIRISNIFTPSNIPASFSSFSWGSWVPIRLNKPTVSSAASGMVGREIFLRYLRFKGYIELKRYPQYKIHYRLKLLRSDTLLLSNFTDYSALYLNVENETSDDTERYTSFRHNYFKMVRFVPSKASVKITTICSGVLPSMPAYQVSTLAAGSSSSYGFNSSVPMSVAASNECLPVDVKITCNDRWKENVYYYIILETDYPIGFQYDSVTGSKHDSVVWSHTWADSPFYFNFFCTGYYTDD